MKKFVKILCTYKNAFITTKKSLPLSNHNRQANISIKRVKYENITTSENCVLLVKNVTLP